MNDKTHLIYNIAVELCDSFNKIQSYSDTIKDLSQDVVDLKQIDANYEGWFKLMKFGYDNGIIIKNSNDSIQSLLETAQQQINEIIKLSTNRDEEL